MQKPYSFISKGRTCARTFSKITKVCKICGKDFKGSYELKKHKNYKHVGASIRSPIRTATKNLKVKMDRKIIYVQNIKKKTPGNH